MTADRVNYITAPATWDPCCCQAVCPWSETTPGDIRVPMHARRGHTSGMDHPRARFTPLHAPGWSAAVHGSDGLRAITLTITAGENGRLRLDRSSPERVPGNLFPGN